MSEEVHSEFCNYDMIRFCPQCLLEDGCDNSGSMGVRTGRIFWRIEHIRTCPEHGILLFTRKKQTRLERLQLMSEVAPDDAVLRAMLAKLKPEDPSDLQDYILSRLRGQKGTAWLDSQPIDLAAKACEMLGIVILFDVDVHLPSLTQSELHRAGHVGFSYASRGEEGLNEAFNLLFERFKEKKLKGAQQKVFGKLYKWLQFKKNVKPTGPIKEVLREYILNHFPIPQGEEILGQKVEHQRVHTVRSFAELIKVDHRSLVRILQDAGLVNSCDDQSHTDLISDVEAAYEAYQKTLNVITLGELPSYLKCSRVLAEQLVKKGAIQRVSDTYRGINGKLKYIPVQAVDTFWKELLENVEIKVQSSDKVLSLKLAADASRWSMFDIVSGIKNGVLRSAEIVDLDEKLSGILIDPQEVRYVLSRRLKNGFVGIDEAVEISGLPADGVSYLARLKKPSGQPYLVKETAKNLKGKDVRIFKKEDLENFKNEHISLIDLSERRNIHFRILKSQLSKQGVNPIVPNVRLGRVYYRRADFD